MALQPKWAQEMQPIRDSFNAGGLTHPQLLDWVNFSGQYAWVYVLLSNRHFSQKNKNNNNQPSSGTFEKNLQYTVYSILVTRRKNSINDRESYNERLNDVPFSNQS